MKEKSNSEDDLNKKDNTGQDSYSQTMSGNFMEKKDSDCDNSNKSKKTKPEFDFDEEFRPKNVKKHTNNLLDMFTNDDVDKMKDNIMKDINKPR